MCATECVFSASVYISCVFDFGSFFYVFSYPRLLLLLLLLLVLDACLYSDETEKEYGFS